METTTPFDLNRAIQQWRENLGQSPAFRSENLYELETHLRDSIAALKCQGLSDEESFLVGLKRIGRNGFLEAEFAKQNAQSIWLDRLFWMVIGTQAWWLICGFLGEVTRNSLLLGMNAAGYDFKAHGYAIPVTLFSLVQLAGLAGSLAVFWWLFRQKGQQLGRWLGQLSRNRTTWILTFCVLFVPPIALNIVYRGINALLINHFGKERITGILVSQSYSNLSIQLITAAFFTWLLLFLARKRLRLNEV